MRNHGLAEWLLKRAAGAERGTAIYGDLTELAATRGPTWFWFAYARTLISLTWRTPVAIAAGATTFVILYGAWIFLPHHLLSMLFAHVYLYNSLQLIAFPLWFLTPFAAVRYGIRDRFVRLAIAIVALITAACLSMQLLPLVVFLVSVALVCVFVSIVSIDWRGAGISFAATTVSSLCAEVFLMWITHIASWYHNRHRFGPHFRLFDIGFAMERHLFWTVMWVMFALNVSVIAVVSTRLHRRFVDRKQIAAT